MDLLCICDEEWCYCTNRVHVDEPTYPAPEIACDDCANGRHVLDNDSRFGQKVAEFIVNG